MAVYFTYIQIPQPILCIGDSRHPTPKYFPTLSPNTGPEPRPCLAGNGRVIHPCLNSTSKTCQHISSYSGNPAALAGGGKGLSELSYYYSPLVPIPSILFHMLHKALLTPFIHLNLGLLLALPSFTLVEGAKSLCIYDRFERKTRYTR